MEGQAFATRQEPLLLEGVILAALEISFALQGRGNRWGPRWQAEALQDRPDRIGQMHCSENPQAPATTVAFENIQRENPRHQLGPWVISRPAAVLILRLARFAFRGRDSPLIAGMCCRRWGLLLRYYERPECRCRRQHRQPLHQLERLIDDVRRSVPPAVLETIDQPAVGQKRQPFRCQRGTVGSIAKRLRQPTFPFV